MIRTDGRPTICSPSVHLPEPEPNPGLLPDERHAMFERAVDGLAAAYGVTHEEAASRLAVVFPDLS